MANDTEDLGPDLSKGVTLADFDGTMLFVSHDRGFLRGLANRVLDVSECAEGKAAKAYPGSYVEWVEKTGMEAPGVHR